MTAPSNALCQPCESQPPAQEVEESVWGKREKPLGRVGDSLPAGSGFRRYSLGWSQNSLAPLRDDDGAGPSGDLSFPTILLKTLV